MRLRIIAAILAASGVALTLGGVASATGLPSTVRSGTEHYWVSGFSLKTGNPTEFVGSGVFTDAGHFGAGSKIVLSKGTFKVNLSKVHFGASLNRTTCLFHETAKGTVNLYDGTGSYKKISGSLTIAGNVYAVFPRTSSGKWNESDTAIPLGIAGLLSGSGKVTIG